MNASTRRKLGIFLGVCLVSCLVVVVTILLQSKSPSEKPITVADVSHERLSQPSSPEPAALLTLLPESVQKEAEEILANARAAIEKIHSGKIVFKRHHMMARGITEEGYENNIRYYTEYWRKQGWNEKDVQAELEKRKAEWNKQLNMEGYDTVDYDGVYIFEGDNAYASVTSAQLMNKSYSAYIYENLIISLETRPNSDRIEAYISEGTISGNKALEPPFWHLKGVTKVLQDQSQWQLTEVSDKAGEKVFDFKTLEHPDTRFFLRITPEEDYPVRECGSVFPRGDGLNISFEGLVRDSDTGIRYPTKLTETHRGPDGTVKREFICELLEVELNRDYDDELFRAPLKEGAQITDSRFDPPKRFQLRIAELPEGYFDGLHVRLER